MDDADQNNPYAFWPTVEQTAESLTPPSPLRKWRTYLLAHCAAAFLTATFGTYETGRLMTVVLVTLGVLFLITAPVVVVFVIWKTMTRRDLGYLDVALIEVVVSLIHMLALWVFLRG